MDVTKMDTGEKRFERDIESFLISERIQQGDSKGAERECNRTGYFSITNFSVTTLPPSIWRV